MSKYTTLEEFKEYELYPELYNHIDEAFPDMDFKRRPNKWVSSRHLDGSKSHSADQTFIGASRPHLVKDNSDNRAKSIIDLYMEKNGGDFISALRSLANICGLTVPEQDGEEYEARRKEQERREEAKRAFTSALWSGTAEAERVLAYIRSRKWTDEEIRRAELGYVDKDVVAALPDAPTGLGYALDFKANSSVGTSHRLVIPYVSGTRILGFKVRNIDHQSGDKATKYINVKGTSKAKGFFGIPVGSKDVTIVEGELDALHAQVKGASSVVATTGGAVGDEQVRDAIRRGVRRFTLLFDNDEKGKGFIASSVEIIQRLGGEAHIATLPEDVKDADEYLGSHSLGDFEDVIRNSIPVCLWNYQNTLNRYAELCNSQGGELTYKQREDFLSEVEGIINAPTTKTYDRELIYGYLEDTGADLQVKVEDFRAYADRTYYREQAKRRSAETREAAYKIGELIKENDTDGALELMRKTATEQGKRDKATEYAKVFSPVSYSSFDTYISQTKEGIPTGFVFEQTGIREELTLNPGLTFICGYRGHGKTSFLNNLAINETGRNIAGATGKSVLYFSYEVDKRRLLTDLLCTYIQEPISRNVSNTMLHYFKSQGEERYRYFGYHNGQERRKDGTTYREYVDRKVDTFKRKYIDSGALVVIEENYKVERLLNAIKYYISSRPVSLICLDYAQLLYSEDYSRQRTEEIKRVVDDIKNFANKEGIPFVLGAQFNREVDSPVSVDTHNIGEGGDFERIADTCIGLFNLKELHPLPKNQGEEKELRKLLGDLGVATLSASDSIKPVQNKIFARLLKRRYGYYPIDTVLDWEGCTKYIKPNAPELLKAEAKQAELFLDPSGEQDGEAPF